MSEWQSFLETKAAKVVNGRVVDFGKAADELGAINNQDIIADLSHHALLSVSGDDAQTFLQGQLTNDVRKVDDTHSQLSAYCSPKGRMLVSFRIFQRNGAYQLRLSSDLVEAIQKRLQMFILMSKVSLERNDDQLIGIGLAGNGIEAKLADKISVLPKEVDEVSQADGYTLLRVAGSPTRFEVYGAPDAMKKLWDSLAGEVTPVGNDAWARLDILAGLPTIVEATSESFVPQMTNLQIINGVSFHKGCYTGQEIVARMQYLGKNKRRMYLAHTETNERPKAGDDLYSPASDSGQGTGKVVDARPSPEGGYDLLAVVQIGIAEGGELIQLYDADGPSLTLKELPYPFPSEEEQTSA